MSDSVRRTVYVVGLTLDDATSYSPLYKSIDAAFDNREREIDSVYEVWVVLDGDNARTVSDREDIW